MPSEHEHVMLRGIGLFSISICCDPAPARGGHIERRHVSADRRHTCAALCCTTPNWILVTRGRVQQNIYDVEARASSPQPPKVVHWLTLAICEELAKGASHVQLWQSMRAGSCMSYDWTCSSLWHLSDASSWLLHHAAQWPLKS